MNLDYESPIMDVYDLDPPTILLDSGDNTCPSYTDPDIGCIVMYDESCPENCIADGIGCVTDVGCIDCLADLGCMSDGVCIGDGVCQSDGLSSLG